MGKSKKQKTNAQKAAWESIKSQIPRGKSDEDKAKRIELFKQFDKDDSKALTVEETCKGCIEILHLDQFTPYARSIVYRAFKKAMTIGTEREGKGDANLVEYLEFRLMMCYIYDYCELMVMFGEMDTSGDNTLQLEELSKAIPMLADWGVQVDDPEATFMEIDRDQSGTVSLDEFGAWAAAQKMERFGDPDGKTPVAVSRAAVPFPDAPKVNGEDEKKPLLPKKAAEESKNIEAGCFSTWFCCGGSS